MPFRMFSWNSVRLVTETKALAAIAGEVAVVANQWQKQAMDYRRNVKQVKSADRIKIKMARNGGWAEALQ